MLLFSRYFERFSGKDAMGSDSSLTSGSSHARSLLLSVSRASASALMAPLARVLVQLSSPLPPPVSAPLVPRADAISPVALAAEDERAGERRGEEADE